MGLIIFNPGLFGDTLAQGPEEEVRSDLRTMRESIVSSRSMIGLDGEALETEAQGFWPKADGDFSARRGHTSVALSDGTIILMGGYIDDTTAKNDVWKSEDGGATWEEVSGDAQWQARGWHESVVLSDDTIILMGGVDYCEDFANNEYYNDVWRSTDGGATWQEVTNDAGWAPREGLAGLVLDSGEGPATIVVMGGTYVEPDSEPVFLNDVWVSDDQGENWSEFLAEADWSARSFHTADALSDGSIILMGGWSDDGVLNDVWHITQDNGSWSASLVNASAEWGARACQASVVLPDDRILLMGGYFDDEQVFEMYNDVWLSDNDGATWSEVNPGADWLARYGHTCVVLPGVEDEVILMGGRYGDWNHSNQVWKSTDDGASWIQQAGFPIFRVYPQFYWVSGTEWAPDADISIEIYDGATEVFSETTRSDQWGYFYFDLWKYGSAEPDVELEPGMVVDIEDQHGYSTSHTIKDLTVTNVDQDLDLVSGLANSAGSQVVVRMWEPARDKVHARKTTADGNKAWQADFSGEDIDYSLTRAIGATEADGAGNTTWSYWLPPVFNVNPADNSIWGHEWPCDTELTITVNGDDYTVQTGEGWDWVGCTDFSFEHEDLVIEEGDIITVTDGDTIKEHVVTELRDVIVDAENDRVSGYAEPGSNVVVDVYDGPSRLVTADVADGSWQAEFYEGAIAMGSDGNAHQLDNEWDGTHIYWRIDAPFFIVDPERGCIWGHEWPCDVELTIIINDEDQYNIQTGEGEYWVECTDFHFEDESLELESGDKVEITDGDISKVHIITNLQITEVDVENRIVSGTADADSEVGVGIHDIQESHKVITAVGGTWEADFSDYDFVAGQGGFASQRDEDGDLTSLEWYITSPFYHVDPKENFVWGHEWEAGEEITVTIMEGADQVYLADGIETNQYGDFWLDLWDHFNILPGHEVTVTDGVSSITHTVTVLKILEVDAGSNTVSGTAKDGTLVEVEIFVEEGEMAPRRLVEVKGGEWEADFSEPGEGDCPYYGKTYNIEAHTRGAADQHEDRARTRIHFEREGASITGQVTDEHGTPVSGAAVMADKVLGDHDWEWLGHVRTDHDGMYHLQGFVEGDYIVWANAPGMFSEEIEFRYPDQTTFNITLEPGGSISGVVRDNEGNPIEYAHVTAEIKVPVSGEDRDDWRSKGGADTDESGFYFIDGLPEGDYKVTAAADGYLTKHYDDSYAWDNAREIEVVVGEETGDIDFNLDRVDKRDTDEDAIADGVAWLVDQQNGDGSWGDEMQVAKTAFALFTLNYHASWHDTTSLDPGYQYYAEVSAGLDYLLAQSHFRNGNEQIYFSTPDDYFYIYKTSIALMAISTTAHPDHLVSDFNGQGDWTLKEIAERIVAFFDDAQMGDGGWSYELTGRSDQSNAGWVTLGLAYAEQDDSGFGFDVEIPGQIRDGLEDWINEIQIDDPDSPDHGGSLYTLLSEDEDMGANALRTGNLLQQMHFLPYPENDQRVQDAIDFLVRIWDIEHNPHYAWRGMPSNYHATYTVMKGLFVYGLDTIGDEHDPIDWFADFSEAIRSEQSEEGWWNGSDFDRYEDGLLSTQWALMTLLEATAETVQRPDLAFDYVDIVPSDPWDETYTINFKVINRGNVATPQDVDVRVYIDGQLKNTFTVTVLGVYETSQEFSYSTSLTGSYDSIELIIDEENTINELRKDNNYYGIDWPTLPRFTVNPRFNQIWGHNWVPNALLEVKVYDDGVEVYSTTVEADDHGEIHPDVFFQLNYDVDVGHVVTIKDTVSDVIRTHEVEYLRVTDVDFDKNIVYGKAAEHREVQVHIWLGYDVHDYPKLIVQADAEGYWEANFDGIHDLSEGDNIDSEVYDDEGNATFAQWREHNRRIGVNPVKNELNVGDWEPNEDVTITIEGDGTYSTTEKTSSWGDLLLELDGIFDIQAGNLITATQGDKTDSYTVTDLAVTGVDYEANTVSGLAAPESSVRVMFLGEEFEDQTVEADHLGRWSAQFSDLGLGSQGYASQYADDDNRGNHTWVQWPHDIVPVDPTWSNLTTYTADVIAYDNGILAASIEELGVLLYNQGSWEVLTPIPAQDLDIDNGKVVASFDYYGIWHYDGVWTHLTSESATALAYDSGILAVSVEGLGVWVHIDNNWSYLTPAVAQVLVLDDGILTGSFDMFGIWQYDGVNWTNFTSATATDMASDGGVLVVSVDELGIWSYDGAWSNLTSATAQLLDIDNNKVAASIEGHGIYLYDGEWQGLTAVAARSLAYDSSSLALSVDGFGLWLYE